MTDHPITPPPELVEEWRNLPEYVSQLRTMSTVTITTERLQDIATQAARWGSDQELEACCAWLRDVDRWKTVADRLRLARRPKPPSLKEQATFAAAVLQSPDETCSIAEIAQHWHTIRRALEALPND